MTKRPALSMVAFMPGRYHRNGCPSGDQSRTERLPRDGDVIERQLAPALELLALLVALAGDDDDVAGPRERDRPLDRGVAVDDCLRRAAVLDPGEDLVDDRG